MGEARHRMATIYHGCKPQIVGREEALDIDTPEDFEFLSAIALAFKSVFQLIGVFCALPILPGHGGVTRFRRLRFYFL